MRFDIAISIGEACQTRKQLSIELHRRFGHYAGGGAFFFDRSSRDQGLVGVCRAISDGFELRREDFAPKLVGHRLKPYNSRYGLFFIHDIKFQASKPGRAANAQLNDGYAAFETKFQHLGQKTRDVLTSGKRILFLVCGNVTSVEADIFAETLRGVDFKVLHMPYSNRRQTGVQHPAFIVSPIKFEPYPGHTESWAHALAPFDLPEIRNFESWLGKRTSDKGGMRNAPTDIPVVSLPTTLLQAGRHLKQHDFASAILLYRQALELAPDNATAVMALAMAFNRTDRAAQALSLLQMVWQAMRAPGAASSATQQASVLAQMGMSHEQLGSACDALEAYRAAARMVPSDELRRRIALLEDLAGPSATRAPPVALKSANATAGSVR